MEFCSIYQITWTICQALVSSTQVLWLNNERKWENALGFQNAAFKICPWILVTLLSAALTWGEELGKDASHLLNNLILQTKVLHISALCLRVRMVIYTSDLFRPVIETIGLK
ncbi:unnamed protein product [Pipistrellus nathusii]|uniref:Uncharacterized protein n=1 Tax=Pipistrellus nathusii TaxID=59473 RepID=A0ABN9ZWD4_PIPNA